MTAPSYSLADPLPTISVTAQAGRPLTITVPVLLASGVGADVVGLEHARAQVRLRWDSDEVLADFSDVLGNAALLGTPGGVDARVVLDATGADTSLWGVSWPRLEAVWDVEVEDTVGEVHPLCAVSPFVLLPEVTRTAGA